MTFRIIFAGTPDFAVPTLQALLNAGYDICAVYSQPDRPAKRGQQLQASAVKQCALDHGLSIYQPLTLRCPEAQATLQALQADLMVVVAYGLLLPESILQAPKHGCINIHGSLLPKWRGAAPIQRAIEAGECETGVTIMQMDKGLDTGAIYTQSRIPLLTSDTSATLFHSMAELGAHTLIEALPAILSGALIASSQEHDKATHAAKLSKSESELDWSMAATSLAQKIHAFNPWPGATLTVDSQCLKIWQASAVENPSPHTLPGTWLSLSEQGLLISCGSGALLISQLQFPNQSRQAVRSLYRQGKLVELFQVKQR